MKFTDLILQKIVFEARYKQGYRFLDRCGETMIDVENKIKGWIAGEAVPTGGSMVNELENMFFNFNSSKLDLSQHYTNISNYKNFIDYSYKFFDITKKNLGLKEYSRFGLRFWFLYPVDSMEKGRNILHKSHIFRENKEVENIFGKKVKDKSAVIVLEEEEKGIRVSLALALKKGMDIKIEQSEPMSTRPHELPRGQKEALMKQLKKIKKKKEDPDIAILLDIDNYINNPQAEYLNNFINESIETTETNVIKVLEDRV
ncbi:chemotaxis protein histidine kinase and related kinases [Candidatus Scalindua japonica]|uniref:Chemotaxis protein histidine kinase and related kinases n=1 Tax=Candidatus Scalindua japonica TaxID=1284222 RepID=A0A286TTC3_9BACT|nr:hypothetical protein [Candidatus Scalindua japonica]GAX59105.1 chemotaxis protein histidine kinase and related kinases [Candidatus Scalindua japonica]